MEPDRGPGHEHGDDEDGRAAERRTRVADQEPGQHGQHPGLDGNGTCHGERPEEWPVPKPPGQREEEPDDDRGVPENERVDDRKRRHHQHVAPRVAHSQDGKCPAGKGGQGSEPHPGRDVEREPAEGKRGKVDRRRVDRGHSRQHVADRAGETQCSTARSGLQMVPPKSEPKPLPAASFRPSSIASWTV